MACTLCIQISFSHKLAHYWGPRGLGRAALGTWPHSEGGTQVLDIRSQSWWATQDNTGHLLIRTCRNSSLSSVPGGWPHSLASQVSHVGMCGAGADGSIPCYTGRQGIQTASETASYTKRGHSAQTWHNPPTLGMTYRHGCKQPITLLLHES